MMGLFSNPKCPRCGRETTIGSGMFERYYKCDHCQNSMRTERLEKEALVKRIKNLEKLNQRLTNGKV